MAVRTEEAAEEEGGGGDREEGEEEEEALLARLPPAAAAAAAAAALAPAAASPPSSLGATFTPRGAASSLATAHMWEAISPERPGKTPAVVMAGTPAARASALAERASFLKREIL